MSDAWFNTADERAALEEAEQVGMAIAMRGPRWLLSPLVGVADPMWFEDLNALRAEVKARQARQQAEVGTPAPEPAPAVKPQPEEPPAEHMFSEEQAEFEAAEDEDDTPHPAHRRPRRRR